jgi:hypothetical protein
MTSEDRAQIPEDIKQPSATWTDPVTGVEQVSFDILDYGIPFGDDIFRLASLDKSAVTICDDTHQLFTGTKTLNASKQHYHKKSTDFGFAVKQRQTEVKSEYRKKAGKLDAKYHQPGDATTFKSILNEYDRGDGVLGLVVGSSGASWRGLVGCSSCRGPGGHPTRLEAPRIRQDVEVNRKGDANPAHLPRLGSLRCTRIRAGHFGSCAGKPGSGARLSQLEERAGRRR